MLTLGMGQPVPYCRATHSCNVRPRQAALPVRLRFCAMVWFTEVPTVVATSIESLCFFTKGSWSVFTGMGMLPSFLLSTFTARKGEPVTYCTCASAKVLILEALAAPSHPPTP